MGKVITIGRQFGSGGREVGKRLAEELSYNYYDKELIKKISEESGLDIDYVENQSEQHTNQTLPYLVGKSFMAYTQPIDTINIELHIAQNTVLKEIAEKENAVIIGRSADYILKEENPLKVFIYASDMDYRIERCYNKVPEDRAKSKKEMQKEILKIDKKRASYYEFTTDQKWSNLGNYNLCIDTSKVGIKGAVEIIKAALLQEI